MQSIPKAPLGLPPDLWWTQQNREIEKTARAIRRKKKVSSAPALNVPAQPITLKVMQQLVLCRLREGIAKTRRELMEQEQILADAEESYAQQHGDDSEEE